MAVTKATIRTSAWDTVYTYLQTTNAITTNNIFSAMNSTLITSKGYPIVIIGVPNISFMKLTANGTMTESEVSMLIEVYDDNAQDVKSLVDNVTDKLIAGRSTFAGATNRLMRMQIDSGDYDTWEDGKKKIHRIGFNVIFRYIK